MTLLASENLCKSFGGLAAISDVSFEIRAAEILALIGPNGAGKTTLLNLITNFIAPDSGDITFRGETIYGLPRHAIVGIGIARTFQALTIFENLSVEDNIAIGQSSARKSGLRNILKNISNKGLKRQNDRTLRQRLNDVMDFVNLHNRLLTRTVSTLSMLEKKRVAIASALASEPKLLLLDEPLSGLNQSEAWELLDLIKTTKNSGTSILLIDHNLEAVMSIAERVLVLNFGKLIKEGTPSQIIKSKKVSEVYLGK